jgi:hypothetical protein
MAATAASIIGLPLNAQTTRDPLPATITADDATVVGVVEFASLPDVQGNAVRMMRLVDEPGTARLFVNGMRGAIFGVSYDGRSVVTTRVGV